MSEIAKCPVCGKEPYGRWCEGKCTHVECCWIIAAGGGLWNQYAAAMELARAVSDMHAKRTPEAYDAVSEAKVRVLEVFGGE